jgi:hypothetical protein
MFEVGLLLIYGKACALANPKEIKNGRAIL